MSFGAFEGLEFSSLAVVLNPTTRSNSCRSAVFFFFLVRFLNQRIIPRRPPFRSFTIRQLDILVIEQLDAIGCSSSALPQVCSAISPQASMRVFACSVAGFPLSFPFPPDHVA